MRAPTGASSHYGSLKSTRISELHAYFSRMRKPAFEPCIPTPATKVPAGADWIHEIKHDGYRLIIQREGKQVRLLTRNGHDWTDRFPLKCGDGIRTSSALHSTRHPLSDEALEPNRLVDVVLI